MCVNIWVVQAGKAAHNPNIVPELHALRPNFGNAGVPYTRMDGGLDTTGAAAAAATTATCRAADAVVVKAVAPAVLRCEEAVIALQRGSAIAALRTEGLQAGSNAADAWAAGVGAGVGTETSSAHEIKQSMRLDEEKARRLDPAVLDSIARSATRRALHTPTMALRRGKFLKHEDPSNAVEVAVMNALNHQEAALHLRRPGKDWVSQET